ncbi:MAG: peptidoglycan-binding protein [Blastococcus sp.]|nr:peptidoglycan-binding protein [Blastococcus sp.]
MSQNEELRPLSAEELAAETGAALPDKEVISLLDLNADLDLAIDAAAPIDLAVAANANVAAPIDAAVGANVLSVDSTAQALSDQGVLIDQGITGEAVANAPQDSTIDQGPDTAEPTPAPAPVGGATETVGDPLSGDLLDVDVDLAADIDLAAPIAGAVAANANVAAPIDAAVAANVGSIGSEATAIAQQDAIITQNIDADAHATADQQSTIAQ